MKTKNPQTNGYTTTTALALPAAIFLLGSVNLAQADIVFARTASVSLTKVVKGFGGITCRRIPFVP